MTYGELLRACREICGVKNKSEFSRRLGFKDPDHYIGAENDANGKLPGRELLEMACQEAGFEFQDCIVLPEKYQKKPETRQEELLVRMLLDILRAGGNSAEWIKGNIITFHESHRRRRPPVDRRKGARLKKRP